AASKATRVRVEDLSKIIASDLLRRESLCRAGLFLRAIARCTMAWSSSFSKSINVRKCRGFMIGFLVFDWVWSREFPPLRPNLVNCGEVGQAMPGPTIFSAQRKRCLHRKERARA